MLRSSLSRFMAVGAAASATTTTSAARFAAVAASSSRSRVVSSSSSKLFKHPYAIRGQSTLMAMTRQPCSTSCVRSFSAAAGAEKSVPLMTFEEALDSQRNIYKTLNSEIMRNQLVSIRQSEADLVTKWQTMLGLLLPLQVHAVIILGYEGSQVGLQQFQMDLQQLIGSGDGHELRELNDEKWTLLLDLCFDTVPGKKLSLTEARAVAADLSSTMQSEPFLKQVDDLIGTMPDATPNSKRQALLQILIPSHIAVLSRHGFDGDNGYIQAQLSLMEHMGDQVVASSVMAGTLAMFGRAGF